MVAGVVMQTQLFVDEAERRILKEGGEGDGGGML